MANELRALVALAGDPGGLSLVPTRWFTPICNSSPKAETCCAAQAVLKMCNLPLSASKY